MAAAKPTHFDLVPFHTALKKFLSVNSKVRSSIRTAFTTHYQAVKSVFVDDHDEPSFKRCVDIGELAGKLANAQIPIENAHLENIGPALICFGGIQLDEAYGDRVPPETDEQKRAKLKLERLLDKMKAEETNEKKKQKILSAEDQRAKDK